MSTPGQPLLPPQTPAPRDAAVDERGAGAPPPYYQHGGVTLYHGDALDVLPTIRTAGIVALDPPYSMVPNSVRGRDDGAAGTSGAPVALLSRTLGETRRLLIDGGVAGLLCDWRRLPDVSYMATLTGLRIATCVAWIRTTVGTGGLLRSAWDPMLVLSSGTPKVRDQAAIPNTVHANAPNPKCHPYEKPVALWSRLFDRIPRTTVVDPFAGSGSSAAAALAAGHVWIGIEVDERYCEVIARRLDQGPLFAEVAV
jgi:site-specific DNA-methyltransferase (adenine-specific)